MGIGSLVKVRNIDKVPNIKLESCAFRLLKREP